jgi:hypothetical protein
MKEEPGPLDQEGLRELGLEIRDFGLVQEQLPILFYCQANCHCRYSFILKLIVVTNTLLLSV